MVIATLKFVTDLLVTNFGDRPLANHYGKLNGKEERIAVLVPIIPDVSHTFIYREILAMQECGGEFTVFGLLKGDMDLVHPEAARLYAQTIFIENCSIASYLLLYLKFMLLMPVRFAGMLAFYKNHCGKGSDFFLECEQLGNLLHPMRSLLLAWALKRHGITKIHSYGFSFPATMALGASLLLDIPLSISTFVDFEHDYEYKMAREKLERSQFVIVVSNYCVTSLLTMTDEKFRSKIHVIHSSVRGDYADHNHHIPEGGVVRIISVARFVEKKGLEYLLKACSRLKQKGIRFNCLIIGDGPELGMLSDMRERLQLNHDVDIIKPMKNDEIKAYYGPDTIVVMPCVNASDGERDGIPNVLLEAMICGSPAVATDISGIPELIHNGVNGLLVVEKDDNALAVALEKLIVDDALRVKLALAGADTVVNRFNLNKKAQHRLDLILRAQ